MGGRSLNRKPLSIPESIRDDVKYDPDTGVLSWADLRGSRRGSLGSEHSPGGYRTFKYAGRSYREHRVAYFLMTGQQVPDGHVIDHINLIKGDNRWSNLRLATYGQNVAYRRSPSRELPKGVYASRKRYFVAIGKKYIGHYSSVEQASTAYQAAFNESYGAEFNIKSLGASQ